MLRARHEHRTMTPASPPLPTLKALPAASFDPLRRVREPVVYRGLAADWPAVRHWSFDRLAARLDDRCVRVVAGNREASATRFADVALRDYLRRLASDDADAALYLKEFDLLRSAPELRRDLRHGRLLPAGHVRSVRTWIGPRGARTGLHCDHLDNLAVQVIGRKRWWIARPGAVERLGAVADKYDAWARLASVGVHELAAAAPAGDLWLVDVEPGDVLHVPAHWWHEVLNLAPSLLFGGFHGAALRVLPRWLHVSARELAHRCGWRRGACTCHEAARPSA